MNDRRELEIDVLFMTSYIINYILSALIFNYYLIIENYLLFTIDVILFSIDIQLLFNNRKLYIYLFCHVIFRSDITGVVTLFSDV